MTELRWPGDQDSPEPTTSSAVLPPLVFNLWEAIEQITAQPRHRHRRFCVTIFGSARLQSDSPLYADVHWLAYQLSQLGCDIMTGGGPGLMEAANAGSVAADPLNQTRSVGLRVELPFEQGANPYVEDLYGHKNFFSRLHHFVLASDAFVVMPGGIGTALEALMIWQLLQVHKLPRIPLICVGPMWQALQHWAEAYMANSLPPLASPADVAIPWCVDQVSAALDLLQQEIQHWQSSAPFQT
jgi:predicted Rossmann-fold nucleotide-binding protein